MNFDFAKLLTLLLSSLGRGKGKVEDIIKDAADVIGALPQEEIEEEIEAVDVKTAQRKLTELGFDPGPVDGWAGAMTEAAIREYQEKAGLEVDGLLGQKTWAKLKGAKKAA